MSSRSLKISKLKGKKLSSDQHEFFGRKELSPSQRLALLKVIKKLVGAPLKSKVRETKQTKGGKSSGAAAALRERQSIEREAQPAAQGGERPGGTEEEHTKESTSSGQGRVDEAGVSSLGGHRRIPHKKYRQRNPCVTTRRNRR